MCTVLLPPGDNPIAVDKCININIPAELFRLTFSNCKHMCVNTSPNLPLFRKDVT